MKLNKTIIITTIIAILTIQMVLAGQWTVYFGSPATGSIEKIRNNNNSAMARTGSGQVLFYNGSSWAEIAKPVHGIGGTVGFDFDLAEDTGYYWVFGNTTEIKTYAYNTVSKTWTSALDTMSLNASTAPIQVNCIHTSNDGGGYDSGSKNECWFHRWNYESRLWGINGTDNLEAQGSGRVYSNRELWQISGSPDKVYYYNGIGWSVRGTHLGATGQAESFSSYNGIYNYVLKWFGDVLQVWNTTSSSWNAPFSAVGGGISNTYNESIAVDQETLGIWLTNASHILYTGNYYDYDFSADTQKATNSLVVSIYHDYDSDKGTMGTADGNIYHFTRDLATPTFSVATSPSSNPTVYGTSTTLTTVLSNSYGTSTTIDVTVYNSTAGDTTVGGSCIMTTGSCSSTISGSTWTNLPVGIYYINTTANDGLRSTIHSVLWNVTANATTNTTVKNVTEFLGDEDFTSVWGLAKINSNRLFGFGNNLSGVSMLSYDVTTPSSITKQAIDVSDTSGFTSPTSISLNGDNLYLGTDDELYLFRNASNALATALVQDADSYDLNPSSWENRVRDVDSTSLGAWACQAGLTSDELRYFNISDNTSTGYTADPCKAIIISGQRAFIRQTDRILIFNITSRTQIGNITGLSEVITDVKTDYMSITGNELYVLSGSNFVRRYNITTNTPVYLDKCYTNYDVISLEALYSKTVIVGTMPSASVNSLRICDFNDTSLYDSGTATYTSSTLTTLDGSEIPYDIVKLDDSGKFAVALNNKIGVYYYNTEVVVTPTNNAPSISSITPSTTTPCVNQTITVAVIATDPEDDDLTYDYDCTGVAPSKVNNYATNLFSCTYTTAGVKTIKAFVDDETSITSSTTTVTASVCTNNNFLNFRVLDLYSSEPIVGATVNVVGQTSGSTNDAGTISFALSTAGTYTITFSKENYASRSLSYETLNAERVVYLTPNVIGEDVTNTLTIYTLDVNDNPISYVLLSITDPTTAIAQIGQTDAVGSAIFTNLATGVQLRVGASKTGYMGGCTSVGAGTQADPYTFDCSSQVISAIYSPSYVSVIIQNGETKSLYIKLANASTVSNRSTNRGCTDDINGIWLCSPLNTSGDGDSCSSDSDCISGRCGVGVGNRVCSNFNWSYCDSKGMSGGNKCFIGATTGGLLGEAGDVMVTSFFYVLIAIVILLFVMIIVRSFKKQ